MTATELIESLQKLIADRPDVSDMYVILVDDPIERASYVSVVEIDGTEMVNIG